MASKPPILPMQEPKQPMHPIAKGGIAAGSAAVALILAHVYANEGGYVNDPKDPGGETNLGVTKAVARQNGYTGRMIDLQKHCSGTVEVCADNIYFDKYIVKPGYAPMVIIAPAVADELVDTAVNMGPPRPSRWFQEALGVPADGKVGQVTITAYLKLEQRVGKVPACVQVLDTLDAKQKAEYLRLIAANPSLARFKNGWLKNRIGNVDRRECET